MKSHGRHCKINSFDCVLYHLGPSNFAIAYLSLVAPLFQKTRRSVWLDSGMDGVVEKQLYFSNENSLCDTTNFRANQPRVLMVKTL